MKFEINKKEQVLQEVEKDSRRASVVANQLLNTADSLQQAFRDLEGLRSCFDGTDGAQKDVGKLEQVDGVLYLLDGAQCFIKGASLRAHQIEESLNKVDPDITMYLKVNEDIPDTTGTAENKIENPDVKSSGVAPDNPQEAPETIVADQPEVVQSPKEGEGKSDPRIDAIMKSLKPGQSVEIKATAAGISHKITETKK